MKVSDVMSPLPNRAYPQEPIREAIQAMEQNHCGFLPVVEGTAVVGVITASDVAIRASASGLGDETTVVSIMTSPAFVISEESDIEEAASLMRQKHLHRLPVVSGLGDVRGMVSMSDIVERTVTETMRLAESAYAGPTLATLPHIPGLYLG